MKKIIIILLLVLNYSNAYSLIKVDITRGNLDPLPIAVSPLHVDPNSEGQQDIKVKDMMKKVQNENIKRKEILTKVLGINPEWRMHLVSSGQRRRVRLFLGLLKIKYN